MYIFKTKHVTGFFFNFVNFVGLDARPFGKNNEIIKLF